MEERILIKRKKTDLSVSVLKDGKVRELTLVAIEEGVGHKTPYSNFHLIVCNGDGFEIYFLELDILGIDYEEGTHDARVVAKVFMITQRMFAFMNQTSSYIEDRKDRIMDFDGVVQAARSDTQSDQV